MKPQKVKSVTYSVPLVQQGLQDCVQASASQLLQFYGVNKSLAEIKREVPVYISNDEVPLGSSLGHMAGYFTKLGLATTMHVADTEIFDVSWKGLKTAEVVEKLKKRKKFVRHATYGEDEFNVIFDGYRSFLEAGGKIELPRVTETYIHELLKAGPIFSAVSYQFLNSVPKYRYNQEEEIFIQDDIQGENTTHALVISGHEDGIFTIVDPDKDYGGVREIESNHLLAAFYLAQINFDNVLITVENNS